MEMLSTEFLSALLAIVIIDLVLAGDNAIVIALAARNLPEVHRRKAIIWGTFGAIGVRTVMTLVVVWLLKIPGLLLMGGVLLVWIAYKLLADNDGPEHHVGAAAGFWGAMKTIVIADAVMGLDNVLAVAGAAHGNFVLVVLGLLISIPIVIWGSQLILTYVERYPFIVYIGGAVLAWTAAKMMVSEPVVKEYLQGQVLLSSLVYITVMAGVLGGGFWVNHTRARARVAKHLVDPDMQSAVDSSVVELNGEGGATMQKILLPVDGSANTLLAARHVADRFRGGSVTEVHLLFVRSSLFQLIPRYVSWTDRKNFRIAEAERALAPARDLLSRSGVPYAEHIETGAKVATIHRVAQRLQAGRIVIGAARRYSLTRLMENMVANSLTSITTVPVTVVTGKSVSRLEKIGVPAGIGAAVTTTLLVIAD